MKVHAHTFGNKEIRYFYNSGTQQWTVKVFIEGKQVGKNAFCSNKKGIPAAIDRALGV